MKKRIALILTILMIAGAAWAGPIVIGGGGLPTTGGALTGDLTMSAASIETAYATVASHATTSAIWAANGNIINFTGAETITAFPNAPQAGAQRTLICASTPTFTHAGNITVQGGGSYTATAGDSVIVTATSTTTFHVAIGGASGLLSSYTEAASDTLTVKQCTGGTINNYGQTADVTITLPPVFANANFCTVLATTVANFYRLDPNDSDSIYVSGATAGDGKYYGVASAALGAKICFEAIQTGASAWDWRADIVEGAWVSE